MIVPIYSTQLVRSGKTTYDARRQVKNTQTACEIVGDLVKPILECSPHEQFLIVSLDTKLKPIGVHPITQGTLDASLVHPREVFRAAFLANASTIMLVHNHPSGDLTPSRADIEMTVRLVDAGKLLGVNVMDHIIVGTDDGGRFVGASLREIADEAWH
ncbi:MAG: JAB domain-containing protein [bacterium]|nr:JAB domain-containing protein [bacterium]